MATNKHNLGELELEVLKIVWNDEPCTVSHIAAIMKNKSGHARTTVLTVMQRLEKKGFVSRKKEKGGLQYSATKQRESVLGNLISQFVDKVLDGSPSLILAHLTQEKKLTKQQINAINQIVEDMENKEDDK